MARPGGLAPFKQTPSAATPSVTLDLGRPSTLQDVVGTRLPYRGALGDEVTAAFVTALFGTPPAEMLALPIAVRDRVVGVLYGDTRQRPTFDEHFAVAARAAGLSLERVLQARRSGS
ncbi:MAG: hypothetical protein H6708_25820 [Kofleriaceae bacterium]|nr:hypothetical protein [Kofleriaceae bacterium]